ncbi:NAD(P)-dependent alcohol dehydrogenase [Pseudonocardia kujensis]|uniref:zinc-dependent alcohol dehydrogenase family protein n=1 Tax=Pseudonocardia kujensis TaxID=1128675 RepID=UPI001E5E563F|nr:NAD(P)-dependent alcohol dehydrogenase [Pseudonocardia kujensis]MCE0763298.1 NAD(P)-dependent alcohol dehydrogenase [Pseudonocardia kujensis]
MKDKMRRWEMDGIGRERLRLSDVPIPTPEQGEVVVEVRAVSLNHRDRLVVDDGRGLPLRFPFTPGSDLSGEVVALGNDASRFQVGDRVISAFTPDWIDGGRAGTARTPAYRTLGGYYQGVLADYVAFPEEWLAPAPMTLTHAQASTLPCAGLTAWFALVERGGLRAGQTVLIEGTGGVALFGIQIACAHGAEVIVSASADKLERARSLGATHVVDRRVDWVEVVLELTGDRGADHVLEIVGGANLGLAVQATAVGGHISQIGALEGFEVSAPVMPLMLKDITIQGIGTGHRRALEDFVRAVDRTGITPVIDSRFPMEALPAALERMDRGPFGKVVVEVQDPSDRH